MAFDYNKWKEKALQKTAEAIKVYSEEYKYDTDIEEISGKKYLVTLSLHNKKDKSTGGEIDIIVIGEDGKSEKARKSNDSCDQVIKIETKVKPQKVVVRKYYKFESSVWSEYKDKLIEEFKGRCAYCESPVTIVDWGDVEHFRPKGNVIENPEHPGYYWLAYDESNYLLSCKKCNEGGGKIDHFPVENNFWVTDPKQNISVEKPLLLDPRTDNPLDHLNFAPSIGGSCNGIVTARTPKGDMSWRIYNLNRGDLPTQRAESQAAVLTDLKTKIATAVLTNKIDEIPKVFNDEIRKVNDCKYRSACISVIENYKEQFLHVAAS